MRFVKRKFALSEKMVDKIKLLCSQKGYTLKSLERDCGFGNSTVARWDKNAPSIDKVQRVCAVLGVPLSAVVDDPCGKESAPAVSGESVLSDVELSLLSAYRAAPAHIKAIVETALSPFYQEAALPISRAE